MATQILLKRNTLANIGTLAVGELFLATDTYDIYIGTSDGNKLVGDSSLATDYLKIDASNDPITGTLTIQSTTDVQELIIKAKAGQTANLQEWQDSSGGVLAYVEKAGLIKSSGRKQAVVTKTDNYTATVNDEVIVCNKTTAMTITLPVASGSGQTYEIKNINTGVVTVSKSGDTIDGETSQTLNQWDCMVVCDYAANGWVIL